ncbi:HYR domain-containing protein [Lewinella sp. JB7]|uniref:HYR-like domain-containing protein n=1 Tax=Lewinella sp. JB7 TaxID=2962887 RepID=UPI0020C966D9|nr:HYR domain-containing protein [Lewinella sp. JB7]MCP9234834.1 HYR domain-containing protein [Lewinella sp. JB7]
MLKIYSSSRHRWQPPARVVRSVGLLLLFVLLALPSFAHTWEIRVNQNQDGTLTWFMQSYHGNNQCGFANSGVRINGVNYPIQASYSGSAATRSANVFSVASPHQSWYTRSSYAIVTTPFIPGTLNVQAYSTNACWAPLYNLPTGNGSFTPPPPPTCSSCPVSSISNTTGTPSDNGTSCDATDDSIPVAITVNHGSCASITGDGKFSLVFDVNGANVPYGPFSYRSGQITTIVNVTAPYGTSNATLVRVVDADFPCSIQGGLSMPGGSFQGAGTPDNEAPVPDVSSLSAVKGQCTVTVTPPTATDACSGAVVATTTDPTSYTTLGDHTVTWTYTDDSGNSSSQVQTVTVYDATAPTPDVATLASVSGECSASVTAPTATDNCGGVITATTTDPTSYTILGDHTVTWTYTDASGNSSSQVQTVTVYDATAPTPDVATLASVSGECSASVTAPTATDNCGGVITATTTDPTSYTTLGDHTVTWTYTDASGNSSSQVQTVTVFDATAPVVANINLMADPQMLGAESHVNAFFTDDCDKEDHAATVDWGDGTTSAGTIDQAVNAVGGAHVYAQPGVYNVQVTVTDGSGNSHSLLSSTYVVIYDPSAGFVTGGGWIWSPAGAYVADPALEAKANFGFVAKYKKGQSVPEGNTTFQLNAAKFKFKSTDYEWLVVSGTKLKFKGTGEINGGGHYGFMLTGVDGDGKDNDDKFRIKIWDMASDAVVYDNQMGKDDTGYETTTIGGGSIVIHGMKGSGKSMNATPATTTVAVETAPRIEQVDVFPNPASDRVTIAFRPVAMDALLTVYSPLGRVVMVRSVPAGQARVELDLTSGAFATGVYSLRLAADGEGVTRRLLIQR